MKKHFWGGNARVCELEYVKARTEPWPTDICNVLNSVSVSHLKIKILKLKTIAYTSNGKG